MLKPEKRSRPVVTMVWTRKRRLRALLVAFVFVVALVAAGSLALHSLLIEATLDPGSKAKQVRLCMCE